MRADHREYLAAARQVTGSSPVAGASFVQVRALRSLHVPFNDPVPHEVQANRRGGVAVRSFDVRMGLPGEWAPRSRGAGHVTGDHNGERVAVHRPARCEDRRGTSALAGDVAAVGACRPGSRRGSFGRDLRAVHIVMDGNAGAGVVRAASSATTTSARTPAVDVGASRRPCNRFPAVA